LTDFVHHEPRPGLLTLHGELTAASTRALHELLMSTLAQHPTVELDLLNVTKLDTAAVQLFVFLHREAMKQGKALRWLGFSMAVQEVFELLDLTDLVGRPGAVLWE
jgi:anti-anti-sigma factor